MKNAAMLLGVALLLAACDGGPTTPGTSEPVRGPTVSGMVVEQDLTQPTYPDLTLKGWSGGAGTVSGAVSGDGDQTTAVATGTLNADGTFSLTLPASVADASLSAIGSALDLQDNALLPAGLSCTAALVPSDAAARGAGLLVAVTAGQKTGAVSPVVQSGQFDEAAQTGTINTRSGVYLYSDRAVSIGGTQTCTGTYQGVAIKATLSSTVQLNRGWNTVSVVSDIVLDENGVTLTTTSQTGALPTDQWLYSSGDLGDLSLPRLPLRR